MADRVLRGSRLGSTSYEADRNHDLAPRRTATYRCPRDHEFTVPMADDAEVPTSWDCRMHGLSSMLIDGSVFLISSANFDYRSFRFQYEIALIGYEQSIIDQLQAHVSETLRSSETFNYESWEKRSFIEKFFEWLLTPFRHLL